MIGRVQKNGPVVQLQISVELEKAIVMRMKIVLGRLNVEAIIALLMTVQVPFFHQQLIVAMIQIQNHVNAHLDKALMVFVQNAHPDLHLMPMEYVDFVQSFQCALIAT